MEHVIFFPAHDGSPAFRRVASLEEAVRLVEHLRNVEGVNEVSMHALTEVPLAFKTWYRVEVPSGEAPVVPVAVEAPVQTPTLAADPFVLAHLEVPEQSVVTLATSNGHAVEAPASLGFFAS